MWMLEEENRLVWGIFASFFELSSCVISFSIIKITTISSCKTYKVETIYNSVVIVWQIKNFSKYQKKEKNQPTDNHPESQEPQGFDDGDDSEVNQQITNNQPTDNHQATTPKEYKNERIKEYKIKDGGVNNININNIQAPPPADNGNVFKLYEQNIGLLSPIVVDILRECVDRQGSELVSLAITEAAKNNAKSIRYIERVLNAWEDDGIKSADAAKLRIAERGHKQNQKELPKNVQNSSFRNYPGDALGESEKEAIRKMMAGSL